jgi:hypothetical protein
VREGGREREKERKRERDARARLPTRACLANTLSTLSHPYLSRTLLSPTQTWVQGPGFRVQGSGFRVQGSGFSQTLSLAAMCLA